jgi:hypothetical protein
MSRICKHSRSCFDRCVRPQKITFGEMRDDMGVRGVLVYCADYRCGHSVAPIAGPDEL